MAKPTMSRPTSELTCICPSPNAESNQGPHSKPKTRHVDFSNSSSAAALDLSLLRTNYHPIRIPTDLSLIQNYLHTATSTLSHFDSDIVHFQDILSNLFAKHTRPQLMIKSHKSLLAPIRRLPNELLSEIFLSRGSTWPLSSASSCTSVNVNVNTSGSKGGNSDRGVDDIGFTNLDPAQDTLWTILQISSLWRKVAKSTPCLWSNLLIDLTPLKSSQPHLYTRLTDRLSFCLSNLLPTALPLNFALIGTHFSDSTLLHPLLTLLCSNSKRWGKVYFCAYTTNVLSNYHKFEDSKFRQLDTPRLESIGLTSFNPTPGFIQTTTRLVHTPNLTKLVLYDYRVVPHVSPPTLNSSDNDTVTSDTDTLSPPPPTPPSFNLLPSFSTRITHLYLDSCPYSTYPDILPYLPSLTHLTTLNKYQSSLRPFSQTSRIHLPNLQSFKTTGWLSNLCFLLPHLSIPSIQKITIIALEEQCYPCRCGVVKLRIVNEWVETLGRDVDVVLNHANSSALRASTDEGIVRFLFADS